MATNVVVSKYFVERLAHRKRERSVRQLISRVGRYNFSVGEKDGYLHQTSKLNINAELTAILVEQYAAFNSPGMVQCWRRTATSV